jgi:methyl-accepting chemotaxis protein
MTSSIGAKIGSGFGLALVILIAIGAVSYTSTVKFMDSAGWVAHTYEVLDNLGGFLAAMTDAETGQRGYLITGQDPYLEPYRVAAAAVDQRLKTLRSLTADNATQQRRLDALEPLVESKLAELQETITLRKDKGFEPAAKVVLSNKGKEVMDRVRQLAKEIVDEETALLKQRSDDERARAQSTKSVIVFGSILALIFVMAAGFVITRNIATPLKEVSQSAQRIAAGDVSVDLPSNNRRDEVGVLTQTFSRMTQSLRQMSEVAQQISQGDLTVEPTPQSEKDVLGNAFLAMVGGLRKAMREIGEGVDVLGASTSEILATTKQVTSGAAETVTSVAETTTTVEQVKQTALVSSQKAKRVSESAQNVAQIAQTGRKSVDGIIVEMTSMRRQMDLIAESVVRLSEQSQAIGEIVATVNDLADQSNLLAVNAAIEAAKAGEQGKGFAVVAQEVRSLAEQSKKATVQVRTILGDIQKATNGAVMATEQGTKAVEAGVRQATQSGESVKALSESIADASQAATQIAASSQQQLLGMDQVASAMENIKVATTQNIAGAQQSQAAAQNLQELGHKLKHLVERYKLSGDRVQPHAARSAAAAS